MSTAILKIIACAAMVCDHVGYLMQTYGVGNIELSSYLRIIGRIAFPIFAFMIAEGFKHTKNVVFYTGRLLLAGIISEVPFNICFYGSIAHKGSLNIMFTLATALLALVFADMCLKASRKEVRFLFIVPILTACYSARNFGMDYGYWGIILIFLFYIIDSDTAKKKMMMIPVVLLFASRKVLEAVIFGQAVASWDKVQFYALITLIPLLLYNGKKSASGGSKSARKIKQYLFYLFYPAHMLILWFIFSNLDKIL